jgi:hypothetical protein
MKRHALSKPHPPILLANLTSHRLAGLESHSRSAIKQAVNPPENMISINSRARPPSRLIHLPFFSLTKPLLLFSSHQWFSSYIVSASRRSRYTHNVVFALLFFLQNSFFLISSLLLLLLLFPPFTPFQRFTFPLRECRFY